jgi:hypothetical protein
MTGTWTARQTGPLLLQILAWCAAHPYVGEDLEPGDITFQQDYDHADGTRTVSVLGEAPQVMAASVNLLEAVDQDLVSFDRGLLVLNVTPRLLYRPLYVGRRADCVVFERVCALCHNSRKMPDWSQGLDSVYGEPRAKPCTECATWEGRQ